MNPIVSILDQAFQGRQVLPGACTSTNTAIHFLIREGEQNCIFDEPEKFSWDEIRQFCFSVRNPNGVEVHLWAIDGCFMTNKSKGQRADCALFTLYEFCFIEFKTGATTTNPQSILEIREKALAQLSESIELLFGALKKHKLHMIGIRIEAYICAPPSWPAKNTALSEAQIEFLEKYGILLFEAGEKQIH